MAVFSGQFEQVVIVVSTGRTGTMALAHYLDGLEAGGERRVRALHEPPPSRNLRVASNRYLGGRLSADDLVDIFARSRRKLFGSIGEPVYVECNNFLHGFLDALGRLFDRPRVVHIVRDVRTFIPSWIDFGVFRGLKGLVGRFHPYWLLKPELVERSPARRWRQMARVERLAWYWSAVNGVLNRGQELFGGDYLRVRFEDLFAEDGRALAELVGWLGLSPAAGLLAQARSGKVNASRHAFPRWADWDGEQRRLVLDQCRGLMERYGYRVGEP